MRTSGKNARNTGKPTLGARKPNPILGAKRAAEFFAKIQQEYEDAAVGHRLQIYKFVQRCYRVGLDFIDDLDEFHRFMSDEFWRNVHRKPKDDQIMKAVLTFAMKVRTSRQRTKVIKIAKILDQFVEDAMEVGQVANYLKENGGIAGLYSQLTGDANKSKRVPDDLEILSLQTEEGEDEGEPEDEEEHDMSPDQDKKREETTEGPTARHTRAATGHARSNEDELAATEMTLAANDGPKITDFGGVASPPKAPGLRNRFDPHRHLAVEMSPTTLAWVLSVQQRIIIEAVVGPRDEWDWRSVKAEKVERRHPSAKPGSSSETDGEDI